MVRNLCERCCYRQSITLHETGVAFDRCRAFHINLSKFNSPVTKCSMFGDAHDPYIMEQEAWLFFVDSGKVTVMKPMSRNNAGNFAHSHQPVGYSTTVPEAKTK